MQGMTGHDHMLTAGSLHPHVCYDGPCYQSIVSTCDATLPVDAPNEAMLHPVTSFSPQVLSAAHMAVAAASGDVKWC